MELTIRIIFLIGCILATKRWEKGIEGKLGKNCIEDSNQHGQLSRLLHVAAAHVRAHRLLAQADARKAVANLVEQRVALRQRVDQRVVFLWARLLLLWLRKLGAGELSGI